jgi:hypothetical protein
MMTAATIPANMATILSQLINPVHQHVYPPNNVTYTFPLPMTYDTNSGAAFSNGFSGKYVP